MRRQAMGNGIRSKQSQGKPKAENKGKQLHVLERQASDLRRKTSHWPEKKDKQFYVLERQASDLRRKTSHWPEKKDKPVTSERQTIGLSVLIRASHRHEKGKLMTWEERQANDLINPSHWDEKGKPSSREIEAIGLRKASPWPKPEAWEMQTSGLNQRPEKGKPVA